jgi:hypothetical protein
MHVRQEPGRFSTLNEHIAKEKISGIERGATRETFARRQVGPHTHEWAQAMVIARGIEGTRVTNRYTCEVTGPLLYFGHNE